MRSQHVHALRRQPGGLLLHANRLFSLFSAHAGMRRYWRDFGSLERWARSLPGRQWWQQFLRDRGGTGFWHEAYFGGGQIESVYVDMPRIGLARFAPVLPARGSLFSARRRSGHTGRKRTAAGHPRRKSCTSGTATAQADRLGGQPSAISRAWLLLLI